MIVLRWGWAMSKNKFNPYTNDKIGMKQMKLSNNSPKNLRYTGNESERKSKIKMIQVNIGFYILDDWLSQVNMQQ